MNTRSIRRASCPMLLVNIGCGVSALLLSSCSSNLHVQQEVQEEGIPAPAYSIVSIIHGDGDYLYHDTSGNNFKADEEALAAVKSVAHRNPRAEVFIFHQKPRSHVLFFFPLPDGEFYYYRSGRLIANEPYWRDEARSYLSSEAELYQQYRADTPHEMVSLFLYYGHGIPEFGGAGYNESSPDRTFTVYDFAGGLRYFLPQSARFDLMVLSTCFGGTPYTVGTLGPYARYIVASPDNLHLSYFDLRSLERLDLGMQEGDVSAFAKQFAHRAFDRLTEDIQTAVSVAVYDVDDVQEFLRSVHGVYNHALTALQVETHASRTTMERCDCADIPAYTISTMSEGVDVLYRAARFGRTKHKETHSGWQCWREKARGPATSQSTE